jgi:hypothetical protein
MYTNSTLSWIALALSVIAIIISLIAFNRASQARSVILGDTQTIVTPTPIIESDPNVIVVTPTLQAQSGFPLNPSGNDRQAAIQRAQEDLQEVRQVVAATGYQPNTNAATEVGRIRNDLRLIFLDANLSARQAWQNIDSSMQEVELRLQSGGANLSASFDRALQALSQDIDYDK